MSENIVSEFINGKIAVKFSSYEHIKSFASLVMKSLTVLDGDNKRISNFERRIKDFTETTFMNVAIDMYKNDTFIENHRFYTDQTTYSGGKRDIVLFEMFEDDCFYVTMSGHILTFSKDGFFNCVSTKNSIQIPENDYTFSSDSIVIAVHKNIKPMSIVKKLKTKVDMIDISQVKDWSQIE